MAKNLIPEIAKMLGVEIGEEFKVKGDDETTYIFTDDGLKLTYDGGIGIVEISSDAAFAALVNGKDEIIKLPWKPKFGDRYFGVFEFNGKLQICRYDIWRGTIAEEAQYRCGWVYRTREEAEAALPVVAKEMGAEYTL
jgi:hypothetical protein